MMMLDIELDDYFFILVLKYIIIYIMSDDYEKYCKYKKNIWH